MKLVLMITSATSARSWGGYGAKDCTPEIDTSESIADFQRHLPMDVQWHFPTAFLFSALCSKGLSLSWWILQEFVQWTFSATSARSWGGLRDACCNGSDDNDNNNNNANIHTHSSNGSSSSSSSSSSDNNSNISSISNSTSNSNNNSKNDTDNDTKHTYANMII